MSAQVEETINRYWVGIHVAVRRGDQYLVMKRSTSDEAAPGCWDLPGGSVLLGEQPSDAAVRETQEEAGIQIAEIRVVGSFAFQYKDKWSVELLALAEYVSGDVQLSPEHTDYQWVSGPEIRHLSPGSLHIRELQKKNIKLQEYIEKQTLAKKV